ncbi:phosphoribosylformylglycinamidine synthase subunit PurQ [Mahella australiensis]|uniref:Phosphoribosylformylglycinamidine synthase subunit PurQ n=1 Tax=Mahella australiensis (strain DSM 15567 / CIP 107919 / 50-1 BON) TaxID=697281 RepID=F3ZZJ1_MAHA5|nr:phosphoribosylformylglycinamidine synthase subunit PurQ [Mahella australiensis]AEE96817.1 phosphoribosylformylglycinamidine synthase subunit I [Mahella australiensis 50-1 BON]
MRFGVIVFPGSNCDSDCYHALMDVMGQDVRYVWHKESDISDVDCIVLPGGFSYGDYLRCGAIARFSPVMQSVQDFAERGKPIIGICNGFQILTEAGLLPGALIRNRGLKFICQPQYIRVEHSRSMFTNMCQDGQVLNVPIAHGEGNYVADQATLEKLEANGQVIFRYCDVQGECTNEANPNGSMHNIAGIVNEAGNVLGMMPHPERVCDPILGGTDGRLIFGSIVEWTKRRIANAK